MVSRNTRQSRRIPWTVAQVRMHRGGFVFVMIVGVLIAAAYSNVVLVIIPPLILLRQVFSWTTYQRGAIYRPASAARVTPVHRPVFSGEDGEWPDDDTPVDPQVGSAITPRKARIQSPTDGMATNRCDSATLAFDPDHRRAQTTEAEGGPLGWGEEPERSIRVDVATDRPASDSARTTGMGGCSRVLEVVARSPHATRSLGRGARRRWSRGGRGVSGGRACERRTAAVQDSSR